MNSVRWRLVNTWLLLQVDIALWRHAWGEVVTANFKR